MTSHTTILNTVENMQIAAEDLQEHIENLNVDFKQQVFEKIKDLKVADTQLLTERVEELKNTEGQELSNMNTVYQQKKKVARVCESQRDRTNTIIDRWVDSWRNRNYIKKIFKIWKGDAMERANEKRSEDFCQAFYEQGLRFRAMRHMKLFAQVAGNRMYERRMKERVTIEVKAKVEELKNQKEFLEALIRELEEKHRIELRKKAILKNQCDQAYLRGVAAISNEALKMSHSTLHDFYSGMKMPNYDGSNVLAQLKHLQGSSTMAEVQIEGTHSILKTQENAVNSTVNSCAAQNISQGEVSGPAGGALKTNKMLNEQSFGR